MDEALIPKKRGRKPVAESSKKHPTPLTLTRRLKLEVEMLADAEGVATATLLRRMIDTHPQMQRFRALLLKQGVVLAD